MMGLKNIGLTTRQSRPISKTEKEMEKYMSFTLKTDENGYLMSFVPKKIWYALYKQQIIV